MARMRARRERERGAHSCARGERTEGRRRERERVSAGWVAITSAIDLITPLARAHDSDYDDDVSVARG